jgi:hypothetical protein
LSRFTSSPRQTISCDGAAAAAHARRKLADLQQSRQHRQFADEPLGYLHLEQIGDSRTDVVERLDAERHAHPSHRSEEVDARRETPSASRPSTRGARIGEPSTARLFHHAVGDLAHLEVDRHRLANANELAGAIELFDEFRESIDGYGSEEGRICGLVPR